MKHTATYKTKTIEKNDKRSFNFGFFEENLCDCSKCQWKCKKDTITFIGFGNGNSKPRQACKEMKIKQVRVDAKTI